jgi:RNA polymerase sigma factor (sigma-70 family)
MNNPGISDIELRTVKPELPDNLNEAEIAYDILARRMGTEPFVSDLEILVRKCKAGDSASWGVLVDRFQALVWSSIYRVGLRNEDAEDTFQKVFLILYKNLDRIDSALALPKWLATTAARESIRLIRQNRDKSAIALDAIDNLDEMIASEESSVEEVMLAAAQSDAIRNVISLLPGKCPQLLTMLYSEEESSYEEVKDRLGIPSGSIGPTRARCIERLRKALISANFFESELKMGEESS